MEEKDLGPEVGNVVLNPWTLDVDTTPRDVDKNLYEAKKDDLFVSRFDAIKPLLVDALAGDKEALNDPRLNAFNLDKIKIALEWILEYSDIPDSTRTDLVQNPWRLAYRAKPPTPEEFLTEKYIGVMAESVYPHIRKAFIEFLDPLKPYRTACLSTCIGTGKAQPLDAKVFVSPDKSRFMGDLAVGDTVLTPFGNSRVFAIHPQGVQDVYEVTLSDGRKTRCTKDHLWYVRNDKKTVVTTTNVLYRNKAVKWYVPTVETFGLYKDSNVDVTIASIKKIGSTEQKCITIEDERGLYVADEGIVTHNSLISVMINLFISTHFALMWSPFKFFNLSPATVFCQCLCATSHKKSSELLAEPFIQLLEQSPFFMKVRTHQEMLSANRDFESSSEVNKMPWTTSTPTSVIQIANGVNYKLISHPNDLLGQTIISSVMSEIGFWREAGYALDVATPILMADGSTKTLADVDVGDALAHPYGKENVVLDVPFDDVDDEYEVTFDDGRTARCNLDHRWKVTHDGIEKIVDTRYILEHPEVSFEVPSI